MTPIACLKTLSLLCTFLQLIKCVFCDSTDLRTTLLENYDPKISPPTKNGQPIKVVLGLIITHFSLEETESVFEANVWFSLGWKDERLGWNHTNDSTVLLRFSNHEIWQPDLTLINNALPTETFHYGESLLVVESDGQVLWTPPAKLVSHCNLNMIRWPYDEHNCIFKMGSWTHNGKEIDIEMSPSVTSIPNHAIDLNLYVPSSEWTLISTTVEKEDEFYRCCTEPYAVVKYSFLIQRNSPSYFATIILPIIIITCVNTFLFILPPTSGEKILLGGINFFIVCIYLIYFEARLPAFGDHLPLIVLLYSINVILIGISIVISVIVIKLSRNIRKPSSPPKYLRMFCNVNFAKILGIGYLVPYVSQTHSRLNEGVEMQPTRENGPRSFDFGDKDDHTSRLVLTDQEMPYLLNAEWMLLAAMIDRLSLIVYTIVSFVVLGLCLA